MEDRQLFSECNATELLDILADGGIFVSPKTPKETLISYIIGDEEPKEWLVMASWRHGLMQLILDNWDNVRAQLSCPAKSGDPRSCFQCRDMTVVGCLTENKDHLGLIHVRRKHER